MQWYQELFSGIKPRLTFYFVPVALTIIVIVWYILYVLKEAILYWRSDYYHMTACPIYKCFFDKGRWGEYLIYRRLKRLKEYKRFLFNCSSQNRIHPRRK